jgi:hypothetical protein
MFNKQALKTCLVWVPVILVIGLLAGCAVKTANLWGDPKTGLILQYRMHDNQVLKYQSTGEQTQKIEVMGQSVDTETNTSNAFTVVYKGLKESNLLLGLTIDSMSVDVQSTQGNLSPDMSSVVGKGFEMVLSPLGKELELPGAESITYSLGQAGERSVATSFQTVFPDMAGRPVKFGDTWTSTDTITEKSDIGDVVLNFTSVNTLVAFETVEGRECVKVTAEVTGTLDGTGEQMGAELTFKGNIKGTETWYFAYKDGVFIKGMVNAFTDGTIEVSGVQSMTIPMKQETKMETKLVK